MKALTLWQPWATGIAIGAKTIETRSWSTKHRGLLAIHASTRTEVEDRKRLLPDEVCTLPVGAVIAIVNVTNVFRMTAENIRATNEKEKAWGDWREGRFGWILEHVLTLDPPIAAKGHQQLWEWSPPTHVEVELTALGYTT